MTYKTGDDSNVSGCEWKGGPPHEGTPAMNSTSNQKKKNAVITNYEYTLSEFFIS